MNDRNSVSSTASGHTKTNEVPSHDVTPEAPPAEKVISSEKRDSYLVDRMDLDDPQNPQGWTTARKWFLTMTAALLVLNATFASSAPSGMSAALIAEFHMSRVVAVLPMSLFVAGFCVGPLLWGPLSEEWGRRPVVILSFFLATMFTLGTALAHNTATLLVLRFLSGSCAASTFSVSGAIISDMWDVKTRGRAIAIFSVAPFIGPALGPTVAGFMYVSGVSWRWLFWLLTMFTGLCVTIMVLFLPETYMPILLVKRAKKLRKETGDDRYYAPMEATKRTLAEQVENVLGRPFKMLFQEPMLAAITAYMSFVYGCLYLYFAAYPIVFARGHHFNAGISGLMFLPIALGGFIAITTYTFTFSRRYEREASRCAPNPVVPEFRLEMTLIGAPIYAISFFWFGWTSSPSTSFWAPLMSGVLNGFGISWIFLSLINYVIDTYLRYAASALSINTVVRSVFGAAFPLFAQQMYEGLGSQWASSLLGFVALAMVPMPFIFIKYGAQLRARSRYSPTAPPRSKESEKSAA